MTVHEMFCREDYRAGPDLGAVVDIGSNIGLSALYFLTRNATSRCHLFEPVPRNVERLRENLAGLEDRWTLTQAAVADRKGTMPFRSEFTGRYGGLGLEGGEQIEVEVRNVNDVLRSVLEAERAIDLLKIDTEGSEAATVAAIDRELLARIGWIVCEDTQGVIDVVGWPRRVRCDTTTLTNPEPRARSVPR
jgi:FkbM family methyltransferase